MTRCRWSENVSPAGSPAVAQNDAGSGSVATMSEYTGTTSRALPGSPGVQASDARTPTPARTAPRAPPPAVPPHGPPRRPHLGPGSRHDPQHRGPLVDPAAAPLHGLRQPADEP